MKRYIAPKVEITMTMVEQFIALSMQQPNEKADDSEVLVRENEDWNIWDKY